MNEALARARDEIAGHMDEILQIFKPGAKITVIVRREGAPDQDFLMTGDDLDKVVALIRRRQGAAG